jgi:hypothetical protein
MPTYTLECLSCHEQVTVFRHLDDHGKWPKHCRRKMRQVIGKFHIMKDIEPYQAVAFDVATGKVPVITSRRRHKEFLRDNGYNEVGNEPIKEQGMPGDKLDTPRAEIIKNFKQVTGSL